MPRPGLYHGPVQPPLALLVVYLLPEDDLWLIDLQLRRLRRHTHLPWRIFAAAPRLPSPGVERLRAAPQVELIDVPPTALRGSDEHAAHLDQLAAAAHAAGARWLCSLDCDAFPVRDRWAHDLTSHLRPWRPVAGLVRHENGDRRLLHPSACLIEAGFHRRHELRFLPPRAARRAPLHRAFQLGFGREYDTGAGVNFALWRAGHRAWTCARSNAVDRHYLLGGIYGDLVFHLGAGSGRLPRLRQDPQHLPLPWRRVDTCARRLPLGGLPGGAQLRRAVQERSDLLLEQLREGHAAARDGLLRELRRDDEALIAELRGVLG